MNKKAQELADGLEKAKKAMKAMCPNCGKKLTPARFDEFGAMVFLECADCRVIWDYISKGAYEALKKTKLRGKVTRETRARRAADLSVVSGVLAGFEVL